MGVHALRPEEFPDASGIVTEDDEPVDSFLAEKCQRLLTGAVYASWAGPPSEEGEPRPRPFLAAANVGLFATPHAPPLVPDVLLSTDCTLDALRAGKDEQKSYFLWVIGKPPEVVIEIVSDKEGDELQTKRRKYARQHVSHYVVWDPRGIYGDRELRVFSMAGDLLREVKVGEAGAIFDGLDLGVRLWEGRFERTQARWLRFTDGAGRLLATGDERAESEKQRADRLAARLRALGVDPDEP